MKFWPSIIIFALSAGIAHSYAVFVFDEWCSGNVREDEKRNFCRKSRSFAKLFAVIAGLAALYVAEHSPA